MSGTPRLSVIYGLRLASLEHQESEAHSIKAVSEVPCTTERLSDCVRLAESVQ
jgi:hypothetical protein